MSMAPNSWTGFRFYQHPDIASTMLPFVSALRGRKLCSGVMSCIIRCRYIARISVPFTANFQELAGLRENGSSLMLLRITHSVSLLISQKIPPAMSAGERTGFNGNSLNSIRLIQILGRAEAHPQPYAYRDHYRRFLCSQRCCRDRLT